MPVCLEEVQCVMVDGEQVCRYRSHSVLGRGGGGGGAGGRDIRIE